MLVASGKHVQNSDLHTYTNEKKGGGRTGVCAHTSVSTFTGLIIGAALQLSGEKAYKASERVFEAMAGIDELYRHYHSEVRLVNKVYMDRAYSNKNVRNCILKFGGEYVCTHQRRKNSPYVHGDKWNTTAKQIVLSTMGYHKTWNVERNNPDPSLSDHKEYYSAIRSGLGNIFYIGTNKSTNVMKINLSPYIGAVDPHQMEVDLLDFIRESGLKRLTCGQSSDKVWFHCRVATISSTADINVTSAMCKFSIANLAPMNRATQALAQLCNMKHFNVAEGSVMTPSPIAEDLVDFEPDMQLESSFVPDEPVYTLEDLNRSTVVVLKGLLDRWGLSKTGNKAALIDRISAHQSNVLDGNSNFVNPAQAIVSRSYLKPFGKSNSSLQDGLRNESFVRDYLPIFLESHSEIKLDKVYEPGLVVRADHETSDKDSLCS